MYSTASFTVLIFSACSSGISISKASSKAITSSTVSSESAPRSSTNEALEVTSPSSTPNCSTMICFTLSSVAVAMCGPSLCKRMGVWIGCCLLFYDFGILFYVGYGVLHGLDGLSLFVRNLHDKSLFQRHDELDSVERIAAEVVNES